MKRSALLMGLALVVGCGVERTASMTCNVNGIVGGQRRHLCYELKTTPSALAANQSGCKAQGGTVSLEPCSTTAALGICAYVEDVESIATVYLFRDATDQGHGATSRQPHGAGVAM
jgi:hypothetical protein